MNVLIRNWSCVILLPLALAGYMYASLNVEADMVLYLGITFFVILIWAFEVLPSVHGAILLPLLYILLDIAPAEKVFFPWQTFLPWVAVAGLVFGDVLGSTGLAKRIALLCVKTMGGSFTAIVVGLMLSGIILAFLVPAIMARVIIFYAVTCGFADALEVKKNSRMSSAILMAGFFAATSPSLLLMTGSEVNLLGINAVNAENAIITWSGFFIHNLPVNLLYCASSIFFAHLIKGKEKLPSKEVVAGMVKEKLTEMGKISVAELKVLALLVFGVTMFVMMGPKEGPWMFLLSACAAFFPGFSLIDEKQLRGLNFGFVFFISGCMAIGFAAEHLGLPALIGRKMAPMFQGESALFSLFGSYGAGIGLNFLLTPLAATSSMSAPLVAVAHELGMNPAPLFYSFLYGLEQYIFPYEYALFLFFFMENRMTLSHILPSLAARMVTTLVLLGLVAYPYWKMLGIL